MAKLTVAQVKEHIETDLPASALQRLIDDAYAEIEKRFGAEAVAPATTVSDSIVGAGRKLFLARPVSSITSVAVTVGTTTTVLAASDYRLRLGGRVLDRLTTDWTGLVEVVFVPRDATRDRVAVDLVKLAVQYEGVSSEKVGDTSTSHLDYSKERERLLQALAPSAFGFA